MPPLNPLRRTAGAISIARAVSIRRDRGSVDDGVPASLRSPSPAAKPKRTKARDAVFISGSSGTSCGMALTRCGALRVIRIPRSTALRRAMLRPEEGLVEEVKESLAALAPGAVI